MGKEKTSSLERVMIFGLVWTVVWTLANVALTIALCLSASYYPYMEAWRDILLIMAWVPYFGVVVVIPVSDGISNA